MNQHATFRIPQKTTTHRHYVPKYHFQLNSACYCRSGKVFGQCCADTSEKRVRPHSIHIAHNYIPKSDCLRFLRKAERQKRTWLSIVDTERSGNGKTAFRRDPARVTQRVELRELQSTANTWFRKACQQFIGKVAAPSWIEAPHLLRYQYGGKYALHSDAEHYDAETGQFYRFIDRDFSMLIYLNDDYEGGELDFPWLRYAYTPQAGDLVIFPSNHIFSHASRPVSAGNKYALVSWGAFHGSARVMQPRSMLPV